MPDHDDRPIEKLYQELKAERTKLGALQELARQEAELLKEFVLFFESGGISGKIDTGMPPEWYLSERVAELLAKLRASLQLVKQLRDELSGREYPVD